MAIELKRIVVASDRSVRCQTLRSIVADVTRGCRRPQEKAVAIFNFLVRTVFMPNHSHRPVEPPDAAARRKVGLDLWFVKDLIITGHCGSCRLWPQAHFGTE